MNDLTAVIIPGESKLPEKMIHTLQQKFKKCIILNSVNDILSDKDTDAISNTTVLFVDIGIIPMLLMSINHPYYLIALTNDFDQILDSEHIKDYLYLGEYPKFETQLHRILRNIDLIIERRSFSKEIERLYKVGSFLGNERSVNNLIDIILEVSMNLLGAEAGSFYSIIDSRTNQWSTFKRPDQYKLLKFEIAKNRRLPVNIQAMTFPILPSTIVGSSVLMSEAILINDVHQIPAKAPYSYDAQVEKKTGYKCKSMLTIPMQDQKGRILGAIQLINKYINDQVSSFNKRDENMMRFLSNFAAIALENSHVYNEMNELLADYERIVQSIDLQKSKHGDELYKFKDLIETNPSALIITDTKGSILYANKQFEVLTGYSPDEVVGKRPSILKSGKMPVEFYESFWRTILDGDEWKGEILNRRKDGKLYWEKSSVSSIKSSEGHLKYFVNTREDITVLKETNHKLSEALHDLKATQSVLVQNEKNAAIGQLAAGMAHEINNPLGFITSNVHTLGDYSLQLIESIDTIIRNAGGQEGNPPVDLSHEIQTDQFEFIKSDLSDLLTETNEGLTRVKKLVEAMRAYSNIDTVGGASLFSVNETIENVSIIFRSVAEGTCEVNVSTGSSVKIYGDSGKLQQAIMNLLLNALDSIKLKGCGVITLLSEVNDDAVRITVKDNGVGIDAQNMARIFNPFFTTKPIGEGAGLGLSQALSIAKTEFNGDIHVESVLDQGASFAILIPLENKS